MTHVPDLTVPTVDGRRSALEVEQSDPGDDLVHLVISDVASDGEVDESVSVSLDATAISELISDLACRLVVLGGREAAMAALGKASGAVSDPERSGAEEVSSAGDAGQPVEWTDILRTWRTGR